MRLRPGSRLARACGTLEIDGEFWCNYGVNRGYQASLEAAGLAPVALGPEGDWRAVEMPSHPFYVATLFLPQRNSAPGLPHPLLAAFVEAAAGGR